MEMDIYSDCYYALWGSEGNIICTRVLCMDPISNELTTLHHGTLTTKRSNGTVL